MNLNPFRRHKAEATVPPELEPYYDTASSSSSRGWLFWILRIVALVVVIALIVLAALWGWHRVNNSSGTTPPSKSQANQSPSKNNMPKPSSKPAPTPSSNSTNTAPVQQPSGTLPNTGG